MNLVLRRTAAAVRAPLRSRPRYIVLIEILRGIVLYCVIFVSYCIVLYSNVSCCIVLYLICIVFPMFCIAYIYIYIYIYIYACIGANYDNNNRVTWNKAILESFLLLTMIPARSQWGRYNLPRCIYKVYQVVLYCIWFVLYCIQYIYIYIYMTYIWIYIYMYIYIYTYYVCVFLSVQFVYCPWAMRCPGTALTFWLCKRCEAAPRSLWTGRPFQKNPLMNKQRNEKWMKMAHL